MNDHPHDMLPGFALGALDAAETLSVVAHLSQCPTCQEEVETFRATVCLLPYTTASHEPPLHVKQQLLARIAAVQQPLPVTQPRPRAAAPPGRTAWPRWTRALAAVALALVLLLGVANLQMQRRLDDVSAQLAEINQVRQLPVAANDNQQLIAFVSNPDTVSRLLDAKQAGAQGRMFMQPGHSRAVIMLTGLGPMRANATYRCWLAKANQPVPVCTISATSDGTVEILFEAPAPIDSYEQVMVTIEPANDGALPSDDIVVQASLS